MTDYKRGVILGYISHLLKRKESGEDKKSSEVQDSDGGYKSRILPIVGLLCSAFLFVLSIFVLWFYNQIYSLPLTASTIVSIASSYLIYKKKGKKSNLEVFLYGGIIFMLSFFVFSVGMSVTDISTRRPPDGGRLLKGHWNKAVCDVGKNWINSTVINDGGDISTEEGGTFLVKDREGRVLCEWNLNATDISNGSVDDDETQVWNRGETISYDFNLNSSPYCDSGMTIESNQDYTLELKIESRSRSDIKTTCTGYYY